MCVPPHVILRLVEPRALAGDDSSSPLVLAGMVRSFGADSDISTWGILVRASVVGAWLMGGIDPCSSSRVGHCRSLVSSWRTNPTSTLVFAFLANSLP